MVWAPRATVAAVIERDGHFLMVEERPEGVTVLNQPAGHLEPGETLAEAAVREVAEETGFAFLPQAVIGVYRWTNPATGITYLRIAFAGSAEGDDGSRPSDPDILRWLWLSRAQIEGRHRRLRSPLVLRCVDDYLTGRRFDLGLLVEM